MKQLFVIRHAKSSWGNMDLNDFDRPLNERGHRDAPVMAKRIWEAGIRLDAIISSPALRAFSTAEYFAEQFGFKKKEIITIERLYHAPAEAFYKVIGEEIKDNLSQIAIFSHNPGITYFVNSMGVAQLDNMPTCGVFGVKVNIESWNEFTKAGKEFLLFDYPKKE